MPYPFPVAIGGDQAKQVCSVCGSENTIFEEYISSDRPDESELVIKCQECSHTEEPDEFGKRFEPADED